MNLNIASCNIKNVKSNITYANYLISRNEITYLNETWLKQNEKNILNNISNTNNFKILFKSDMNEENTKGRPFGGQAWFISKKIKVKEYKFINKHISFIDATYNEVDMKIIGVYLPFDNNNLSTKNEYEQCLTQLKALLDNKKLSVIIGDFNADLNRNRPFDKLLKRFINSMNLVPMDMLCTQVYNSTYKAHLKNKIIKSNIDHCLVLNNKIIYNMQTNILEDDLNTSDHNSLMTSIEFKSLIDIDNHKENNNSPSNNVEFKKKSSFLDLDNPLVLNEYRKLVGISFSDFYNKFYDKNIDSINPKLISINDLYNNIVNMIVEAHNNTIEYQENIKKNLYKNSNSNNKNSWFTADLKEIKNEIIRKRNQYNLNKDENILIEIKELKKTFRSQQRKNMYLQDKKECNKVERLAKIKNKKSFWHKVAVLKNQRSSKDKIELSTHDVAQFYKSFFTEDRTSSHYEQSTIDKKVCEYYEYCLSDLSKFSFKKDDLIIAVKEANSSNTKGYDGISYNMLKKIDLDIFYIIILELFNTIIKTKKIPDKFNISIISPITKDYNKNINDLNNIRPISVSNCLSQLFEKLILISSPSLSITSVNQFGFKKRTSCDQAIFVVKETIANYLDNGSSCRLAALDAEKAFDKVWRQGLFYKLIDKLNPHVWLALKQYYDKSSGVVRLNDILSDTFSISCGVKQGGILSPFLFNLYINDLIEECLAKNIGALHGNVNTSIVMYADDVILLSPIDKHLQQLLLICEKYAEKWKIKFNTKKSCILSFDTEYIRDFKLCNECLPNSNSTRYLGIMINNKLDFNKEAKDKFKVVQKAIYSLHFLGLKPLMMNPYLQSFFFKTHCLAKFTYTIPNSTLDTNTRNQINVLQNNLIRMIIGLKRSCHISKILKVLKIYNFDELYIISKLRLFITINNNYLSKKIFTKILNDNLIKPRKSSSISNDFNFIESTLVDTIQNIVKQPMKYITQIKKQLKCDDGISSSIRTCLNNFSDPTHRKMLQDLTKSYESNI